MIQWTSSPDGCYNSSLGNLDNLTYDLTNNITTRTENTKFVMCNSSTVALSSPKFNLNFETAKIVCENLGHTIMVIDDENSLVEVRKHMELNKLGTSTFWAGFTDNLEEGKFLNSYDNSERKMDAWNKGDPNGGTYQNCLAVKLYANSTDMKFIDTFCQEENYFFCKHGLDRIVSIRGIPENSGLYGVDTKYFYDIHLNKFRGQKSSEIILNEEYWVIVSKSGDEIGFTRSTQNKMPPFGTNEWTYKENMTINLNMNSCNTSEFACANGICLPESKKCNQIGDCTGADNSDEEGCDLVKKPTGYNKVIPPPGVTNVNLDLEILDILSMDVINNRLTAKIKILKGWTDSRLKFTNLKTESTENIMNYETLSNIWVPSLTVYNTDDKISTNKIDTEFNNFFYLAKSPHSQSSNFNSDLVKNFEFNGKDVFIGGISSYTIELGCKYTFEVYPFDTQICLFEIYPDSAQKDKIIFSIINMTSECINDLYNPCIDQGTFNVQDEIQFLEYTLGKLVVFHKNETDIMGLYQKTFLVFTLKRNLRPVLIKTFLPTMLLVFISQLSTYFLGDDMFDGIIAVNATILMTLATLFVDSFNSMPTSSYIKYSLLIEKNKVFVYYKIMVIVYMEKAR